MRNIVRCPHGRTISMCKICGANSCEHGNLKYFCSECGRYKCLHGNLKYICRECNPDKFCDHGKRKYNCRICGGYPCDHGILKYNCRTCKGSNICVHSLLRANCKSCYPTRLKLRSKRWCIVCLNTLLDNNRARTRVCGGCDSTLPQRIELVLRPLIIQEVGLQPFASDDILFGGEHCRGSETEKRARPDLAWAESKIVVIFELDEDGGHPDRIPECEMGRMWTLTSSVKQLMGEDTRVYFIRMNPDACDSGKYSVEERVKVVAKRIRELLSLNDREICAITPLVPHVEYYYYHSRARHQIEAAVARPDALHVYIDETCAKMKLHSPEIDEM